MSDVREYSGGEQLLMRDIGRLETKATSAAAFTAILLSYLPGDPEDYCFGLPTVRVGAVGRPLPGVEMFDEFPLAAIVDRWPIPVNWRGFRSALVAGFFVHKEWSSSLLAQRDFLGVDDFLGHGAIDLRFLVEREADAEEYDISLTSVRALSGLGVDGSVGEWVHPGYGTVMEAFQRRSKDPKRA